MADKNVRPTRMSIITRDWRAEPAQSQRLAVESARGMSVAIAGAGLITPLGNSATQTWEAILRGEAIADHSLVKRQWGGRSRVTGLAIDAARHAIAEAGWHEQELRSAALVVATSKGKVLEWLDRGMCGAGIGDVAHEVAGELSLQSGPRLTVSAACAGGLHGLIRGALMIKAREAQRVLVVAAEASVHEMFLGSFKRLGVLAKAAEGCRPFDQRRSGFLMSEAGVAVCLQAGDGEAGGGTVLIERMAMGGDATHLVGGDGQAVTMRGLLAEVLDGRAVDLVHAHGTGTVQNDQIELAAIERCVVAAGGPKPSLYSHKGALGHSLGAAGLVSVAINRLCHESGWVPPTLGENAMKMRGVRISRNGERRRVQRSIATAAGFGGAIGVVSLVSG